MTQPDHDAYRPYTQQPAPQWGVPPQMPPRHGRRLRVTLIAAAAAVVVGAAALVLALRGPASITIHGSLDVQDSSGGGGCDLGDGFSDIATGTQVVVTAPDGTVIGSGALGTPHAEGDGIDCVFPFTVTGVQGGEARYGVTVSHRGTVWFSPAQAPAAALTLS